jgi:proline iminopeptidase
MLSNHPIRKKISLCALFLFNLGLAVLAASAVFIGLVYLSEQIYLTLLAALFVFGFVVFITGRWVARLWGTAVPGRFGFGLALGGTLLLAVGLYFGVLRPGPSASPAALRPETKFWDLPTGSRIAYSHYPAQGTAQPYPLVYLHGGPGAMPHGEGWGDDYGFMRQFTQDGYNVYLYDQAGSGQSALREKLSDYSILKNIEDLEAIRQVLGAEKMILLGQSWGGALAANYLARYPERVERVIFTSPGEMWEGESSHPSDYSRTAGRGSDLGTSTRFELAYLLLDINPQAAQALLPQREANQFMEDLTQNLLAQSFCKEDAAKVPVLPPGKPLGFNLYSVLLTEANQKGLNDPRPALSKLKTPALILKSGCDYIAWETTYQYRQALSESKLVYIRNAGHLIWASQPEQAAQIIRAFLAGQTLPLPAYEGSQEPEG